MEIATNTAIATSTIVATSTAKLNEVPEWFSYTVDIALILIFLFILFFVKPEKSSDSIKEELSEDEKPNPLEQVLKTDSTEEAKEEEKNKE